MLLKNKKGGAGPQAVRDDKKKRIRKTSVRWKKTTPQCDWEFLAICVEIENRYTKLLEGDFSPSLRLRVGLI